MLPSLPHLRRDLFLLTALCACLYALGLTTHGLTNWQEAQRALVAREMQVRFHEGAQDAWLVPTINGNPYLAKPPLFYWAQVALAEALGRTAGEFELRAVVAICGLLGALATYLVARRLFGESPPPEHLARDRGDSWARDAALWSALSLATGVLYVRSSRIGELDIMLVPFVVVAIGAILKSWRKHRERGGTDIRAVTVATVATIGAVFTKGPSGLAIIALGAYGGIAAWTAFTREPVVGFLIPRYFILGQFPFPGRGFARPIAKPASDVPSAVVWAASTLAGVAAFAVSLRQAESAADVLGAAMIGLMVGIVSCVVVRLLHPSRALAFWAALCRTHPVGVLGIPALVFWLWWRHVVGVIGPQAALLAAQAEADDNLRFFTPESPLVNLEAIAYGVGLGSIACIIAAIWLIKDRPRIRPAWVVLGAWVFLGVVLFSLTTKGVARYLTPVWPGVAMLGGLWIATRIGESRSPMRTRALFGAIVGVLFVSQTYWYARGREQYFGERSPRALVNELLDPRIDAALLVTFEFRTPAIDFYADYGVSPVGEIGMRESMAGIKSLSLAELAAIVKSSERPIVVLLRLSGPDALGDRTKKPAAERLAEAGFTVALLKTQSHFITDSGRSVIGAAVVSLPP